jgi:hypothetical protein
VKVELVTVAANNPGNMERWQKVSITLEYIGARSRN